MVGDLWKRWMIRGGQDGEEGEERGKGGKGGRERMGEGMKSRDRCFDIHRGPDPHHAILTIPEIECLIVNYRVTAIIWQSWLLCVQTPIIFSH